MRAHKGDAETVAGNLYDVLAGYDPDAFSPKATSKGEQARTEWVGDITKSYAETAAK